MRGRNHWGGIDGQKNVSGPHDVWRPIGKRGAGWGRSGRGEWGYLEGGGLERERETDAEGWGEREREGEREKTQTL